MPSGAADTNGVGNNGGCQENAVNVGGDVELVVRLEVTKGYMWSELFREGCVGAFG